MRYLVAIDGGGSNCRAAVATTDGHILGLGKAGPANIVSDVPTTAANIILATENAFLEAKLDIQAIGECLAVLGLAGHNVSAATDTLSGVLPFKRSEFYSDGAIALQGALGTGDGGAAIIGTGTMYMWRVNGNESYFGGWGFPAGDQGSGADLGSSLLRQVLLGLDGVEKRSKIIEATLADFGGSGAEIVHHIRSSSPGILARYAPGVFEGAQNGDAVATAIIRRGVKHIDDALGVLVRRHGCQKLCLLGGLAPLYKQWIAEDLQCLLCDPQGNALDGAIAIAVRSFLTGGSAR